MSDAPSAEPAVSAPVRKKGGHAASVLLCGAIFIAAGFAAAYLAFAPRVTVPGASKSASASVPSLKGLPREPRARIAWRPWGGKAFQEAAASRRLILLDLTTAWSHWSRLMELQTYGEERVGQWVSENVVPVRLDRDARPDLARRYGAAVPTTALLLPSGETLSDGAYAGPDAFLGWAGRVAESFRSNREAILDSRDRARARAAERVGELLGLHRDEAWKALSTQARRARAEEAVQAGLDAIGRAETSERRFPSPAAQRFLYELLDAKERFPSGPEVPARARRLLAGLAALEDPAWGGLYRYSRCPDWSCPEREKLLAVQAAAIEDAAGAGPRGLGSEWAALARRIAAFVEERMKGEGGSYVASLSADAEQAGGWLDGEAYYAAEGSRRPALGVLCADPAAYAAGHADLAVGLLAAGDLAAGHRPAARKIIGMLELATSRDGRLRHRLDEPSGESGLLDDQLAGARAFLAAHRATGDARRLAQGRKLLAYARTALRDPASGGLRVRAPGGGPLPGWSEPVDPDQTAACALLLDDLAAASRAAPDAEEAAAALDWALARAGAVDPVLRARVALRRLRQ